LFDAESSSAFSNTLQKLLKSEIEVIKVDYHINERAFADEAAALMIKMIHNRF